MYRYETHLHTCESSACGTSSGADYIIPYINLGYSGIFVTDHFFGGNTSAPREGDWKKRVDAYCKGYETALAEAEKINKQNNTIGTEKEFKVFFGIEQTFQGDDYLIYGLDKQWLYEHPEVEHMTHQELFNAVNSVNGLMIQAHPFRLRGYMDAIHIHPREVHGVEIYNAGNKPEENHIAREYAKTYNLTATSGSDNHNINGFYPAGPDKNILGGMEFDSPLQDVFDYAKKIKCNKGNLLGILNQ